MVDPCQTKSNHNYYTEEKTLKQTNCIFSSNALIKPSLTDVTSAALSLCLILTKSPVSSEAPCTLIISPHKTLALPPHTSLQRCTGAETKMTACPQSTASLLEVSE